MGGWVRGTLLIHRKAELAEFHAQRQRVIEERAEMLAGMASLRDIPGQIMLSVPARACLDEQRYAHPTTALNYNSIQQAIS